MSHTFDATAAVPSFCNECVSFDATASYPDCDCFNQLRYRIHKSVENAAAFGIDTSKPPTELTRKEIKAHREAVLFSGKGRKARMRQRMNSKARIKAVRK